MKTTTKILILAIALAVSVFGILLFAKTRVQPPMKVEMTDQYSKDLSEFSTNLSDNHNTMKANDSIFASLQNRIDIFLKEGKIDETKANEGLEDGRARYVPEFLTYCFSKFRQSEWHKDDHEYMKSRISYLAEINFYGGSSLMTQEEKDSAALVVQIIGKYDKAVSVSRQTSFSGVANARTTIQEATSYMNDEYLSNCTSLVDVLSQVKSKLNESHYNYVLYRIDKMAGYRYLSRDYYDNTLVPEVESVIKEYRDNASSLYGSKKNVDNLWSRARGYYDQASDYYESGNYIER